MKLQGDNLFQAWSTRSRSGPCRASSAGVESPGKSLVPKPVLIVLGLAAVRLVAWLVLRG